MSESNPDKQTGADQGGLVEEWMQMVLHTGGIQRFDNLHLDEIKPEWKSRDAWIVGSSEAIKLARESRDRIAPDKVLALMCSLTCEPDDTPPTSLEELATQIDWSPPSLYLFERDSEPWRLSSGVTVIRLDELFDGCTCLLLQFLAADEQMPRRSFIAIA